jgi:hypothetical protein
VELILRFLALFYNLDGYEKPMKQFLNSFMKENKDAGTDRLAEFNTLFQRTADVVLHHLGPKPFNLHTGLNAAAYDAVFTAFAHNLARIDKGGALALRAKFNLLKGKASFVKLVSAATTDEDVIPKRIRIAKRVLFG